MLTTSPIPNAETGAPPTDLSQTLSNLQHAFAQCREAIFIADATGIICRINPAFEKLTGYSSHDAVGKDLSAMTAEGPHSEDYRRIWDRVLQQRSFSGSISLRQKSGDSVVVDITVTPVLDSHGRIGNLVCTSSMWGQQTLQNDPSNLRPNSHPGQVKEVVHTINNVLASVMAQAELSFEALPPEHPVRVRLKGIREGCRHAADLVRLLFDLEQGDSATVPEPLHYQATASKSVFKPDKPVLAKARTAAAG